MNAGRIRKFFPGANSAYGFYSLYGEISGPSFRKVFILKGGPGTGKSTFLRSIGEAMRGDGFDVEYHYCSADPQSLDGVVIPAIGVTLLDGTAPHVIDPRFPGALEEIINLGAFWDEAYLVKRKQRIQDLVGRISHLYRQAYHCLFAAKGYRDAVDSYYSESNHCYTTTMDSLALELVEEILGGKSRNNQRAGIRKLFASSITAKGAVHHLKNLVNPFSLVYILRGENGGGKKRIIERVAEAALMRGFFVEAFYCALDPRHIDHLLIPELEVALINGIEPHCPELEHIFRDVDTSRFVANLPAEINREKEELHLNYRQAFNSAISFLAKAHKLHDELEKCYIPAMRFKEIEQLGEQILDWIRKQAVKL